MSTQARLVMALTVVFVVMAFLPISATIIEVPEDYSTIQAGIDASSDRDTVLVAEGHYYERINFYGKGILLTSEFMLDDDTMHIQNTIIDADTLVLGVADTGSVVCFVNSEDSTSVIQGFSIQKGIGIKNIYNNRKGGGICCWESSPTISNNTINGNYTNYIGGGIFCYNSNPTIINNTITGNSTSWGGGINCWEYSSPIISNNTIAGNYAVLEGGGIYCEDNSFHTISNNTISGNYANSGGGIFFLRYSPTIRNNTITGNSANYGGGVYCNCSNPVVVNTILWANITESGGNDIYLYSSSITITYSDIQDTLWPGESNINTDPLFRDPDNADFHLMAIEYGFPFDSPCIDAGHPDIFDSFLDSLWGLGTNRSDMGAYGGEAYQTDIPEITEQFIPKKFILSQNYPNPFNPTTTISFAIEHPQFVTLKVYDLLGREVRMLIDEDRQAGLHNVIFDASKLASGIYFYRLQAGDISESKRMVLLK